MRVPVSRVVGGTVVAGIAVFCVVQDRVTAAGVRRYVSVQRDAIVRGTPAIAIDSVMQPAVRQSVVDGGLAGGFVILCGLSGAAMVTLRNRRG
jgi:hypothetical protein